jgi:hypothetical protein
MNRADDLEKRIKRIRVTTTDALDRRILADARAGLENPRSTRPDARRSGVWRTMMRSHWMKLAAGFLLVLVATLGVLVLLGPTAPAAYALEQTLEANQALRYIHIRIEPNVKGRMSEAWAQFDEGGKLLRLRMIFPTTEDGAKEVLWQEDKAEVWFKTKGHAVVVQEKAMLQRMPEMLKAFDPRVATEELHQAQASGKVQIETRDPSAEGEPITLVVSFTDSRDRRSLFRINPQTKLVEQHEIQRFTDGKWESLARHEYLEYNQEVPPGTFALDIPPDVTRIDQTTQKIGLAKGDLTDEQIAAKVAREFFEALIAEDYGRAGALYEGIPASKMEQTFGKIEFLRILSVGDPTPHPDVRTRFLQVPCEVELRVGGETHVKTFTPAIRAVYNQPDRWGIGGGI